MENNFKEEEVIVPVSATENEALENEKTGENEELSFEDEDDDDLGEAEETDEPLED